MASRFGSVSLNIRTLGGVLALALSACVGLTLAGCDQQRRTLADMISPPEARQIADRIDDAVEHNQGGAGIETGVAFLKNYPDPDGLVHRALAKAYLSTGNAAEAARQMELSIAGGAMTEPNPAPQPTNVAAPAHPAVVAGDAAVIQNSDSIVVKAGDASASLSK